MQGCVVGCPWTALITHFCLYLIFLYSFSSPFSPHEVFSQPLQNTQSAKVYTFPIDLVLQTLYLYLVIIIWLSCHFSLDHQGKTWYYPSPLFILQYAAFSCCSLISGTTAQSRPPAYTVLSFCYLSCPEILQDSFWFTMLFRERLCWSWIHYLIYS